MTTPTEIHEYSGLPTVTGDTLAPGPWLLAVLRDPRSWRELATRLCMVPPDEQQAIQALIAMQFAGNVTRTGTEIARRALASGHTPDPGGNRTANTRSG